MKISFLLLLLLFPLALLTGSVSLPAAEVWQVLCGHEATHTARFIVLDYRVPQALTAVCSGAALAVSGLVMQTLFANPLADPSLLGVNSGASLGAAVALLLCGGTAAIAGMQAGGIVLTVLMAMLGAMAVMLLLVLCSMWLRGRLALLVAGVMIGFALSAVISLLSFFATAEGVRSFVVWGMGDFGGVSRAHIPYYCLGVVCLLGGVWLMARPLNALLLGSDYAANLGVHVRRCRTVLLLLTGMLTALVTAFCGPILFIGLAVPHIARLLLHSSDHSRMFPVTALMGANVALLALVLSHLPGELGVLPLAAITPLIGVPVVLTLLLRKQS